MSVVIWATDIVGRKCRVVCHGPNCIPGPIGVARIFCGVVVLNTQAKPAKLTTPTLQLSFAQQQFPHKFHIVLRLGGMHLQLVPIKITPHFSLLGVHVHLMHPLATPMLGPRWYMLHVSNLTTQRRSKKTRRVQRNRVGVCMFMHRLTQGARTWPTLPLFVC